MVLCCEPPESNMTSQASHWVDGYLAHYIRLATLSTAHHRSENGLSTGTDRLMFLQPPSCKVPDS